MTGVEFLERAMDIFPRARRVLLTAYADTEAAITAINVVDLDHYLLKPWDPPEEKLYPVVDELLEAWRRAPDRPATETRIVGHRWSAALLRAARPARPQPGALPLPPRRRPRGPPPARGRGTRRRAAAASSSPGRARRCVDPTDAEVAEKAGLATHADRGALRPRGRRRRPGRARRGRLRRVGGTAHRARRVGGHRRAGRARRAASRTTWASPTASRAPSSPTARGVRP